MSDKSRPWVSYKAVLRLRKLLFKLATNRRIIFRVENLKMTCSSCGEHVEFPIHGIGETVACPHCANTITLHMSD